MGERKERMLSWTSLGKSVNEGGADAMGLGLGLGFGGEIGEIFGGKWKGRWRWRMLIDSRQLF